MSFRLNNYDLPGPLTPINNQVLIKLSKTDDRTKGGLFVATENAQKPTEGIVVAAGDGEINPDTGALLPNTVSEGDLVMLGEYAGEKVDYCGEQHVFIDGNSILGRFEGGVPSADAFVPLRDRLLVKVVQAATETASGIALAMADDEDDDNQGEVIKAGAGRLTAKGEPLPMGVSAGDSVIYTKFAGAEISLDDAKYVVVDAGSCLAKW
jgi:chaperonin GroES